jgi:hypothetical protein
MLNAEIIIKIAGGIMKDAQHMAIDATMIENADDCMSLLSHIEIAQRNLNRMKDALRAELEEREFSDI